MNKYVKLLHHFQSFVKVKIKKLNQQKECQDVVKEVKV